MSAAADLTGWVGAGLLLAAYALVSSKRLAAAGAGFQSLNVLGATGLTVNSGYHEAWPSAALNVVWITVGLGALLGHRLSDTRHHRRRQSRRGASPAAG